MLATCFLAAGWVSGQVTADTAEGAGRPEDEEAAAVAVEAARAENNQEEALSSGLNAARLLPVGVPCFGVRMPDFEADLLVSNIHVRELIRIDDRHLDMRDLELERYRADGAIDYVVTVERGFFDMGSGRLTSSTPTRLRGKAFDLQGEGCDYARHAPVIKILGKVTSYIYPERAKSPESEDEVESRGPQSQEP